MSTCDEPRPPNGPSPIATASGQRWAFLSVILIGMSRMSSVGSNEVLSNFSTVQFLLVLFLPFECELMQYIYIYIYSADQ